MKIEKRSSPSGIKLRRKAEQAIKKSSFKTTEFNSKNDLLHLNQELQIHQIELEMQNEELKKTRDETEKLLIKYSLLYNYAPNGYLTINKNGIIKELNFAAASILGKDRSLLLGKKFEFFISENYLNYFSEIFQNAFESNLKVSCELLMVNDLYVYFECVLDDDTQNCNVVIEDITECKQHKIQLQKYNDKLKAKNKFFSILAHDLRAPYQALLNLSEILVDEINILSKEEILEYCQILKSSIQKQYNLLTDLLDWSRIQNKNFVLVTETVLLRNEISKTIERLSLTAQQKEIELRNNLNEDFTIQAEASMLRLVLRNLISNGIKFTNSKGFIEISAVKKDNIIEITVADNGVGMSENDIARLFVADTRFSTDGTAMEQGTGLGLLLCKEIVEKHGGKIWVESKLGVGSNFKFTMNVE